MDPHLSRSLLFNFPPRYRRVRWAGNALHLLSAPNDVQISSLSRSCFIGLSAFLISARTRSASSNFPFLFAPATASYHTAASFVHHFALKTTSSPVCNHHPASFTRSLYQAMDQVPPWQHINEGYESPTEAVCSFWPTTHAHWN